MKKYLFILLACLTIMSGLSIKAEAKSGKIPNNVHIGSVDVSGMEEKAALAAVDNYMSKIANSKVTFTGLDDASVTLSASELGILWTNRDVIDDAVNIGHKGNVVHRYKESKDVVNGGKNYNLDVSVDDTVLTEVFENKCSSFNQKAQNYTLKRNGSSFTVVDGVAGHAINEAESIKKVHETMDNWDGNDCTIGLSIDVTEPEGSKDALKDVKDVLGTYTTTYKTSGAARCTNIANGCRLASGLTLYPGDEFNMLNQITPFTEANGYALAGSYLNGQVVESFGGGICQVSTTLYNAVLRAELKVTERSNHSMIVTYVDPSCDAAIAENGGKNFRFVNNTKYPVYIEGYTSGKAITFTIYGKEERDAGRKVSYSSETLETTDPDKDNFVTDASLPVGYVKVTQSAHKGIKAQLWKIVTVNGKEESREVVNSSNYKMVPRIVTVGVAGCDENCLAMLNAAIATGSYNQVSATASTIAATLQPAQPQVVDPNAQVADPNAQPAQPADPNAQAADPNAMQGQQVPQVQQPDAQTNPGQQIPVPTDPTVVGN